jgi:hypothetical protein
MLASSISLSEVTHPSFQENTYRPATISELADAKEESKRLVRPRLNTKQDEHGKILQYVISIFYVRPEFGENCEFLSTYYAKEKNGARYLKKIFARAFKRAHPTWKMKKLTIFPV